MRGIFWVVMLLIPVTFGGFGIDWFAYRDMPRLLPKFRIDGDPMTKFDPDIGFVARPDSSSMPHEDYSETVKIAYHVYTDHRGARVSAPGEQTAQPLDIMFLGDSFPWGQGVDEPETFPYLAAKKLNVSGANFAMFAWGTVQSLQMLRRNQDLKPRVVVYSFVTDNLRRNVTPCAPGYYPFCYDVSHVARGADGSFQIKPPRGNGMERVRLQLLAEQSQLGPLAWVSHGIDVILSRQYRQSAFNQGMDIVQQNDAFDFLLGQLADTCKDIGARLLVVYIPQRGGGPPTPAMTNAVAKHGLAFLDVTNALHQRPAPELYLVNGHLNPAGHRIVADEIAANLSVPARQ
jgi:hypothetical protein